MPPRTVAVVGGSLAGLRAAEQLRACGFTGGITVYGAEPHHPYNRPPLSKEALGDGASSTAAELASRLAFRRRPSVNDVSFRLGTSVAGVDPTAGTLSLTDGTVETFDGLVIATGLRPRRLAVPGPLGGRHSLRTVEDCIALRLAVTGARTAIVVGGGFIGTEVACTLTALGLAVTVIEPTGPPMGRVLGAELAEAVARHHTRHGIEFLSAGVQSVTGDETATGVRLDDGRELTADVLVEAVGSQCNTEWLAGADFDLTDGVLTDNLLRANGADRTVVVGDIARFPNPLFDDVPRRVEHWSIPTDTAKRAAATLAGLLTDVAVDEAPFSPIPAFWSDQRDLRLQSYGSPGLADEIRLEEGSFEHVAEGVLVSYLRSGILVGNVSVNLSPARHRSLREALAPVPSPG